MDKSEFKEKKKVSPEVIAIRNLCDALSNCLESAKNNVKKQYQARYSMFLSYINNYRAFLSKTESELRLHYKWYLMIYDEFYDWIPGIIDEKHHGIEGKDFMLDSGTDVWIGRGSETETKNYRLSISLVYKYAISASNRCLKMYSNSSEIDPKLQLDYLTPWEIKYYFMKVLFNAVINRNPEDPDLEELRTIKKKLKETANLTKEQAKQNARKTVSGFAKNAANMMKAMGLKDKNGNPISADIGDAGASADIITNLFNEDMMETLGDAFNTDAKSPEEALDGMMNKVLPVVKKSLVNIPKPPGVKEKEGSGSSVADKLFSESGQKNIKKGIMHLGKVFTGDSDDEEKSGSEDNREISDSESSSD